MACCAVTSCSNPWCPVCTVSACFAVIVCGRTLRAADMVGLQVCTLVAGHPPPCRGPKLSANQDLGLEQTA